MTQKRQYPEKLLIRIVRDTKTIDDLVKVCALYKDLEMQGDITVTHRINRTVRIHQFYLIHNF